MTHVVLGRCSCSRASILASKTTFKAKVPAYMLTGKGSIAKHSG